MNVERAEEVLMHKKLLEMAAVSVNNLPFDVRIVQVKTLSLFFNDSSIQDSKKGC